MHFSENKYSVSIKRYSDVSIPKTITVTCIKVTQSVTPIHPDIAYTIYINNDNHRKTMVILKKIFLHIFKLFYIL